MAQSWGYTRIRDALSNLGYEIGRNTIKRILIEAGIDLHATSREHTRLGVRYDGSVMALQGGRRGLGYWFLPLGLCLAACSKAPGTGAHIQHVVVIAMENQDLQSIAGNGDASYINQTLLPRYASASRFTDELPVAVPSEPHYIWMEAGSNVFADHAFNDDSAPSATNSTASRAHLVTQIEHAGGGLDWRSYQEGLDEQTGACPIHESGFYAPKHDPFVFFQDVAGKPPSASAARCAQHHKPLSALAADLARGELPRYVFITPNLCHDMHGQSGCPDSNTIRAGDAWLASELPALIAFANAHQGVIFIVWDEGEQGTFMPFLAIGPHVRAGHVSSVPYSHSSLLRSIEEILGLPRLPTVASTEDFTDLFEHGAFP